MTDLIKMSRLGGMETKVDEQGVFEGYASTFGNVDNGRDVVMPGAFTKTLKERGISGVKMLWMHDACEPIGVWTSLEEDSKGLKARGKLLLTLEKANEVYAMMKEGIVDSLSIGFRTVKDAYDSARSVRQIIEADLWEVSCVTFPMNEDAKVQAVKGGIVIPTRKEIEAALRNEGGFGTADARKATAVIKKLLRNGEDEPADELRKEAITSAITEQSEKLIRTLLSKG